MTRTDPEVSVVVPLHNEAATVDHLVVELRAVLRATTDAHELVLVDDGSSDGTWDRLRALHLGEPGDIVGVRLSRNFGKEAAIRAGVERARGRAVVVMDGDLQHPPSLLPRLVERWRVGDVEVVEGVKRDVRRTLLDRAFSKVFNRLFTLLADFNLEGASDYKLLDRRAVGAWLELTERHLFFRGTAAWIGFRRDTMTYDVADRRAGSTQWSFLARVRLALIGISAFSSAPLRLVTALGLAFLAFSAALAAQTLWFKISGRAVSGFTTVILLLLIVGGAILFGLGIIGEYLARIYDEVKGRPRFLVMEQLRADPPGE